MTYFHTIRHLKPVQVYGRLLFRVIRPRPDLRPAAQLRPTAGKWVAPFARRRSMIAPHRFVFLNEEHDLDGRGWDDAALDKLWRYNLHYFDDLNAVDAAHRKDLHRDLLLRWVRQNPPGHGTGWEPYPTSLRIVNWIKWALAGNALPAECIDSLAVQARWLSRRLERHILGNHLFVNAKALVFAGAFFQGREAERWSETGQRVLDRQIDEQILYDGGHFERSPMYHALLLEDVLDLLNLDAAYHGSASSRTFEKLRAVSSRMRSWLRTMTHPDDEIAFFNDSAFDIAPPPRALEAYAARLELTALDPSPEGLVHLADSGYIRVERDGAVAFLDVAPVSGGYLTAHAHADTLSFELSLGAARVIVNSGTSRYGNDAERLRQRGTAAHSTVVIDGENSSEVWGGFRVARRARPRDLSFDTGKKLAISCAHDGYHRLAGKPTHQRIWSFGAYSLAVQDEITGRFNVAEARFHLHPHVEVVELKHDSALLKTADGSIRVTCTGGSLARQAATWHPAFGVSEPNTCLSIVFDGAKIRTRFDWSGA